MDTRNQISALLAERAKIRARNRQIARELHALRMKLRRNKDEPVPSFEELMASLDTTS